MPEKAGGSLGDRDPTHNREPFSNARSWQSGMQWGIWARNAVQVPSPGAEITFRRAIVGNTVWV